LRLTSLIILLAFLLHGCSKEPAEEAEVIATKKNDKIITFVTINSPNTYYINERDDYAGLEYDLAKLYVSSLGPDYQARFIVVDSFAKVIPTILENKADIAAADISITENG